MASLLLEEGRDERRKGRWEGERKGAKQEERKFQKFNMGFNSKW